MKVQLKKPYGKAAFARVTHARYLSWEDAFDVEFEDGLCFLEPHAAIRKANRISSVAKPVAVEVDSKLGSHFAVTYDSGERAEVSWSFVRELPPRHGTRSVAKMRHLVTARPHRVAEKKSVRYGRAAKSRKRTRRTRS